MKLILLILSLFTANLASAQLERNCGYDGVVERAYLSCVACGVKDIVGRTPSMKYLSLLAVSANQLTDLDIENPSKRKNNDIAANLNARNNFYRLMAEQIQAFGICMDKKVDSNGNVTAQKGYGHLTRSEWNAVTPLIVNRNKADKSNLKNAAKIFGYKDRESFSEMINYTDWSRLTPQGRQARFRQSLSKALKPDLSGSESPDSEIIRLGDSNGDGLQDCLKQIDNLQTRPGSIFNFSKSSALPERGLRLCRSIANSCGIENNHFCEGPIITQETIVGTGKNTRPPVSNEPSFNLYDGTKNKGAK